MSAQFFVVLLPAAIVVAYAAVALRAYFRMRGKRMVVCPETKAPAGVTVDAAHAAVSALWETPDVRLRSCSRWPERADCDQACTAQIAAAPADTLAINILKRWYTGRNCAVCHRPILGVHTSEPRPGLLNVATRQTIGWEEIPTEHLPAILETHLPVCASCHLADVFRREFPDRVTDRAFTDKRDAAVH